MCSSRQQRSRPRQDPPPPILSTVGEGDSARAALWLPIAPRTCPVLYYLLKSRLLEALKKTEGGREQENHPRSPNSLSWGQKRPGFWPRFAGCEERAGKRGKAKPLAGFGPLSGRSQSHEDSPAFRAPLRTIPKPSQPRRGGTSTDLRSALCAGPASACLLGPPW